MASSAVSQVELSQVNVELASTAPYLIEEAKRGIQVANKAKIAINELKAKAKEVADFVDGFADGPYYRVVIEGKKLIDDAKALGLENAPEIKTLIDAQSKLSDLRKQLGNGSDYTKMFK